jgi:hypothetical protein
LGPWRRLVCSTSLLCLELYTDHNRSGWNNVGGRDGGWRNGRRPEYTTIGYNPGWNWNQPNYYEPVYYTSYIASPTWDVPSYPIITIEAPPIAQPDVSDFQCPFRSCFNPYHSLAALLFQQPNILSPKLRQHSPAPSPKHPKEQLQYMSIKMGNNTLMAPALFSRFMYIQLPRALIWWAMDSNAEELEEVGNERLGALLSI